MNRNSLLALATLIALLWIESGNCKMQNDHEVDIAKRQQQQVVELKEWKNATPEPTCVKLRDCQAKEWEKKKKEGTLQVPYNVMEFDNRLAKCGGVTPLKYQTWWKKVCMMGWRAEAEMADEDEADEDEDEEEDEKEDEDEADEAKSDEVDIAKRQKGLKTVNPDQLCETLKNCQEDCIPDTLQYKVSVVQNCVVKCGKISTKDFFDWQFKCGLMGRRAEAEMADEDEADEDEEEDEADEEEADEAKSDEVDIAKRQKGLKILKAWKRDEAEMADVDEADKARSDKAQN